MAIQKIEEGVSGASAANIIYQNDLQNQQTAQDALDAVGGIDRTNELTAASTAGYYNSTGGFSAAANWRTVKVDAPDKLVIKSVIELAGAARAVVAWTETGVTVLQAGSFEGEVAIPDGVISVAISSRALAGDTYYAYATYSANGKIERLDEKIGTVEMSDIFAKAAAGYYTDSGAFFPAGNWKGVKFATEGIETINAKLVNTGSQAWTVIYWDEANVVHVLQRYSFDGQISIPADAKNMALTSRAITGDTYFAYDTTVRPLADYVTDLIKEVDDISARLPASGSVNNRALKSFKPTKIYATQGDPLRIYPYNLINVAPDDLSIDIFAPIQYSNEKGIFISSAANQVIPLKIRNYDGVTADFGTIQVVAKAAVNPSGLTFVLPTGDSLTEGSGSIQGAYPNELSRLLNGTGVAIPNGRTARALNNYKVIGTLGDQIIKHEGRGGWSAATYTTTAANNAFWNPATSQFDLNMYLTNNGFYTQGVASDGSNLIMPIMLNWNSVYNQTIAQFKQYYTTLLNRIFATNPKTKVLLLGINPPPLKNMKAFTGQRNASPASILGDCIDYENALAELALINTAQIVHVPLLPVFCAGGGNYKTSPQKINLRDSNTTDFVDDYVHPANLGYGSIADIVFNAIISAF